MNNGLSSDNGSVSNYPNNNNYTSNGHNSNNSNSNNINISTNHSHSVPTTIPTSPSDLLSYLHTVSSTWHGINLDSIRSNLDSSALAIQSDSERSTTARKSLAEITKKLKSSPEAEQVQQFGPVVKAYQEEINQLTRRSKFAENSFLLLYKQLYEAIDPVHVIDEFLAIYPKYTQTLTANQSLQSELASYDTEFQSLKNQEYTIKKLQTEINDWNAKYQAKCEELAANNSEELNGIIAELKQRLVETENNYSLKLNQLKQSYNQLLLTTTHTQTQLFDQNSNIELIDKQKELEFEILNKELEKANQTILQLKTQIEKMNINNINNNNHNNSTHSNNSLIEYDNEINQLRSQLELSEEKLRLSQSEFNEQITQLTNKYAKITEENRNLHNTINQLKFTIQSLPTIEEYNKIKHELYDLQSIQANNHSIINESTVKFENEITRLKLELHEKIEQNKRLDNELN